MLFSLVYYLRMSHKKWKLTYRLGETGLPSSCASLSDWGSGSKTPKIPPFHCVSVANAWASAHALSMVMWSNHQIVNGYYLNMFTLLFELLLLRVFIMNFQMVSFFFCPSTLHILFGRLFFLYTSQVESMSYNLSCLIFSESTHVILSELIFML